ncbi:hypothetical protein R5W23_003401 [Gemmata sp. JC673]|uniref:Uncharacterized protein n=1 Tax=Gemmata algarum TaxID=2975278 RepID=A0ABU5F330_9BACT|nr:hypothetical protein [Gemmata algarum]MDY3561970.1 hypothetical protein [Gemmata algarum]
MGWEQRNGGTYYYTAKRVGGRVVKQYVGSGVIAELTAQLDDLNRAERARAVEEERHERESLSALAASLAPLNDWADAATTAALIVAGCHRPKRGQWRRRRV